MIKKEEYIKQLYETEQELLEMSKSNPILDKDYINTIITKIDNIIILILDDEYKLNKDVKEDILDITYSYSEHNEPWESYKQIIEATLLGLAVGKMCSTQTLQDTQVLLTEMEQGNHIPHID